MKKASGLIIVVAAAILMELVAIVQYYFTHQILSTQLERTAEVELAIKDVVISGVLRQTEQTLRDYSGVFRKNMTNADSIYAVLSDMLQSNNVLAGCGATLVKEDKNGDPELSELYATYRDGSLVTLELKDSVSQLENYLYYCEMKAKDSVKYDWTDPYFDHEGAQEYVTTISMLLRNEEDGHFCLYGADLSLDWLDETLNSRHLYPSAFLMLLTENGEAIALPEAQQDNEDDDGLLVSKLICNDSTENIRTKGRVKILPFKSEQTGQRGRVFFYDIGVKPHWRIALVCYDNEVFAQLTSMNILVLILNLLTIGVLVFIVMRFANSQQRLFKTQMEQEHINSELHIASEIQSAMLPRALPEEDCIDIVGSQVPARQVGGDFYDYFIRDGKLFFCIGDVSGKGLPSALIMAMTEAVFHSSSMHEDDPALIMQDINTMVNRNNEANMFVTLFIGVLHLANGRLLFCNAGHCRPLIISQEILSLDSDPILPVGVFEDTQYQTMEEQLSPDSMLLIYTDGLTEAMDADNQQFSMDRVKKVLQDLGKPSSARLVLARLSQAVSTFVGLAEQSDDQTIMVVHYKHPQEKNQLLEAVGKDMQVSMNIDMNEVTSMKNFVLNLANEVGMSASETKKLRLIVEEAMANVINYSGASQLTIKAHVSDGQLYVSLIDNGIPFDPTTVPEPDLTIPAEKRKEGGLGIMYMRQMSDGMIYHRESNQNILVIQKKIK